MNTSSLPTRQRTNKPQCWCAAGLVCSTAWVFPHKTLCTYTCICGREGLKYVCNHIRHELVALQLSPTDNKQHNAVSTSSQNPHLGGRDWSKVTSCSPNPSPHLFSFSFNNQTQANKQAPPSSPLTPCNTPHVCSTGRTQDAHSVLASL